MPIYEFFSPDTNRIYSFFARTLEQGRRTPRCPDRPDARMERLVSRFAVTGRARETVAPGEAEAGLDPRMERVMADMEREMSSLNEDNPDPRQLGRMMRRMSEAAGQPMPAAMQEMIGRLEKGEDPEKLEAEYGDSLEELGEIGGEAGQDKESATPRVRRAPQRDPKMYEMRDYTE